MSPIYHCEYENLVLNGVLRGEGGEEKPFFFFSGVHSKDFPWGDGEVFWDVGLAIREAENKWRRFALTDRVIEGLDLDVKAGSYRYKGPIFEIVEGHQVFKSELDDPETSGRLRRVEAEINLRFESRPLKTVHLPFSFLPRLRLLPKKIQEGDQRLASPSSNPGSSSHAPPSSHSKKAGSTLSRDLPQAGIK